jgi:hypothetical protein
MAASRSTRTLVFFVFTAAWSAGQQPPQHSSQTVMPEKVTLEEISSVPVSSLPAEGIAMPVLCDADGNVAFRLAMPDTGVEDPVSISSDGKTITRFSREKINDIPRPALVSMFRSQAELYILTRGSTPLGSDAKWRMPNGQVETHQASRSSTFVAHFRRDGSYAGAVPLDLPFKPLHLGVFANGDFLIAGADLTSDEPRVAIVGSNGELRRAIELRGDVHALQESNGLGKGKDDPTALPRSKTWEGLAESLRDVVATSQIAADGPNLLLFRPMSGPVVSISPSGEVRAHELKVKGDYRLFTIKATQGTWIAELTHHLDDGTGEEFATYAFDPESGTPLKEYFFPRDLGFGLACVDREEFTFVMADFEGKALKLVKLGPSTLPK